MKLTRFWFELAPNSTYDNVRFGVTAWSYADAISLLKTLVFKHKEMPPFIREAKNIDVSTLDANHVLPNMSAPNVRGIWFPAGFWFPMDY